MSMLQMQGYPQPRSHVLTRLQSDTLHISWGVGNRGGVDGSAFLRLLSVNLNASAPVMAIPANTPDFPTPVTLERSLLVSPFTYSPTVECIAVPFEVLDSHPFTLTVVAAPVLRHFDFINVTAAGFSRVNIPVGTSISMNFLIQNQGQAPAVVTLLSEVLLGTLSVQRHPFTFTVPAGSEPDDPYNFVVHDTFVPSVPGDYTWHLVDTPFDPDPTPAPFGVVPA